VIDIANVYQIKEGDVSVEDQIKGMHCDIGQKCFHQSYALMYEILKSD